MNTLTAKAVKVRLQVSQDTAFLIENPQMVQMFHEQSTQDAREEVIREVGELISQLSLLVCTMEVV